MKVIRFILITFLFTGVSIAGAQKPGDKMPDNNINLVYLSELVKKGIDSVRLSIGLNALESHPVLTMAAQDHANYLREKKTLSHTQSGNSKKRSPQNRVDYYGGKGIYAGENAILTYIHVPMEDPEDPEGEPVTLETYGEAANDIVRLWITSPGHYQNLISSQYTMTGVAFSYDITEHCLRGVQVFGTQAGK